MVLKQGEKMGRFPFGPPVVRLFRKGPLRFNPEWAAGRGVRLGEVMAYGRFAVRIQAVRCTGKTSGPGSG